jgi:hypothetical protein
MMWFTELLFNILPGYNKFRAVSTALVVVQWTVPLLAAMGVAQIIKAEADDKRLHKALAWATGVCVGVLAVMIIGGRQLGDFGMQESGEMLTEQFRQMLEQQGAGEYIKQGLHEQLAWSTASGIAEERAMAMRGDAWRSLLFVVLAAQIYMTAFGLGLDSTSSICAGILAVVGLLVLFQVCKPFDKLRRLVWAAMALALLGCFTLLGGLLDLRIAGGKELLIMVTLLLMTPTVFFTVQRVFDWGDRAVAWARDIWQRRKEW